MHEPATMECQVLRGKRGGRWVGLQGPGLVRERVFVQAERGVSMGQPGEKGNLSVD